MKPVITILLIVTIVIQTFSKWFVILVFEMNKDYIASNLCVNRIKPSSCCKGKCFLQKNLDADTAQQEPAGKSVHQGDTQADFFLHDLERMDLRMPALGNQNNFYHLNGKSQDFIPSPFQPPQS